MNREKVDLTSAAALFGESFSARVEVLERLLGHAHYPSIGRYKERLLVQALKDYLPSSVEIGTGFVLFPREADDTEKHEFFDSLNQAAFEISKQCDLLIYKSSEYPPIFRDGNFVVVRPESLVSVIEVKGTLGRQALKNALDGFWDFSQKWMRTQEFYDEGTLSTCSVPKLHLMAWGLKTNSKGNVELGAEKIREKIASFYSSELEEDPWSQKMPFLESLYVHKTLTVSHCFSVDDKSCHTSGWASEDGRFIRRSESGDLFFEGDKTISALLASLHYQIDSDNFNRFISYADEVRGGNAKLSNSKYNGYTPAWFES